MGRWSGSTRPGGTAPSATSATALSQAGVDTAGLLGAGHRVVHGGDRYTEATLVDDSVEQGIQELVELAPLHNPPALAGIRATRTAFPDLPQVGGLRHRLLLRPACGFGDVRARAWRWPSRAASDGTARTGSATSTSRARPPGSWATLEQSSRSSAPPRQRRVSGRDPGRCGRRHLDGADAARGAGHGHPPGRRRRRGSPAPAAQRLRRRPARGAAAPPLGAAGAGRHARLPRPARGGGPRREARPDRAYGVYCHRLRKYVGGYLAVLGGADAIVFTAGVGENVPRVRADALRDLGALGIEVDPALNAGEGSGSRTIAADGSGVDLLVVPTDEELAIARQVQNLLSGSHGG